MRNTAVNVLIAVVDDDDSVRESTKTLLRSAGYRVVTFVSAAGLLLDAAALRETKCLILDIFMPGIDGLELQRRLNAAHSRIPIIFITAHADERCRQEVLAAGAADFLYKPFKAQALLAAMQIALEKNASSQSSCSGRT